MKRWLFALARILAGYALVFRILPSPALRRWLPWRDLVLIPTSRGQYTLAALVTSLVLFTLVLIVMQKGHSEASICPGRRAFEGGVLGGCLLGVIVAATSVFYPDLGRQQAAALGLVTPWDFLIHTTWYAWVWSAFREEIFFRGLVQTETQASQPGSWGLLVPLFYFSSIHYFGSPDPAVGFTWSLSTLPGGLVFTALYFATGRLTAPIVAHALNNTVAGLLTGIGVFQPTWLTPSALVVFGVASFLLTWQRKLLIELSTMTWSRLCQKFWSGAGSSVMMLIALILGTAIVRRIFPV